jgi:hypothetical protein
MSGLMRGDYAARWQAYAIARANNILSVDEIREAEGYGPLAAPGHDGGPMAEAGAERSVPATP